MKKLSRVYPNIKESWGRNKELSMSADFERETVKVIKRRKYKYFRVHAMGEFYDAEYLKLWYDIARECKGVKFYAYSKNYDVVTACKDLKPDNFTMVYSIKKIDDIHYPSPRELDSMGFDSIAMISKPIDGQIAYKKELICPALWNHEENRLKTKEEKKKDGANVCMKSCTRCADRNQFIVLPLH
jgi:hypothetical protein